MSIRSWDWQYSPNRNEYKKREEIPESERCEHCDGLGLVRLRFSGCFGNHDDDPRGSKDWQECYHCGGTGRNPDEDPEID
jgi:hypothetical protein